MFSKKTRIEEPRTKMPRTKDVIQMKTKNQERIQKNTNSKIRTAPAAVFTSRGVRKEEPRIQDAKSQRINTKENQGPKKNTNPKISKGLEILKPFEI